MVAAYAVFDFIFVPSAVENLPNCIVEAFVCGRPAVAFDSGGIRDAVHDGKTGLLVPQGDVNGLAIAIARLPDDVQLRIRLGKTALAMAICEFSAELQAERF